MADPVVITLLGRPVPAAQGSRGKNGFRFVPKRQSEAVAAIRAVASEQMVGRSMLDGPLRVDFTAIVPIPKTTTKKARAAILRGELLPIKKPDLKNLAALAEDACKSVVFSDDCLVCEHASRKAYGERPQITIIISEIA